MKVLTSVTLWNDAVGKRMSVSYSVIDAETGQIIEDNKRKDRVVTDAEAKSLIESINEYAQAFIDSVE